MMLTLPDPEDLGGYDLLLLGDLLAPAATALGITLVGNIGTWSMSSLHDIVNKQLIFCKNVNKKLSFFQKFKHIDFIHQKCKQTADFSQI